MRFAFERSGRTPKVSCSLNGTRAKIVNYHMDGCSASGSMEGKEWPSRLTPAIKDAAIAVLARRYGGGASEPITIIAGDFNLKTREEVEKTLHMMHGWGLGICARPPTPARLKLRFAS